MYDIIRIGNYCIKKQGGPLLMETFEITSKEKKELETIGNFYREAIYSQKNLPDALSEFANELDSFDGEISQTIISEVLQYQKLIQNRNFFAVLREWINELYEQFSSVLPKEVSFTIECRRKGVQSAVRKMLRNYFEKSSIDLSDLVAFRIILDSNLLKEQLIQFCYSISDNCMDFFKGKRCTLCAPSRKVGESNLIKDYISHPKKNGYQSIHLTFKTLEKDIFECQIRTLDMHEHAEIGDAKHGDYKNSEYSWLEPYINIDPSKVHIPHFRVLNNGTLYDQIGLLDAMHIERRSKTF